MEFPTKDAPEGMMHAWFSKKSYDLSAKHNKHYVCTGGRVVNGRIIKGKMREMTFSPVTIYTGAPPGFRVAKIGFIPGFSYGKIDINGVSVETTQATRSSNPPSFEDVEYRGLVLVPNV